jgi:hypothetical protein
VFGFLIIGSPATQRSRELDQRTVSNLSMIQSQVEFYWRQNGVLPGSLDDLENLPGSIICSDPGACKTSACNGLENCGTYEYRVINPTTFELCAYFNASSDKAGIIKVPSYDYYQGDWSHGAGRVCFERETALIEIEIK